MNYIMFETEINYKKLLALFLKEILSRVTDFTENITE